MQTTGDQWGWRSYTDQYWHHGTDIPVASGTAVKAILDGTIDYLGDDSQMGKYIRMKHSVNGTNFYSWYLHLTVGTRLAEGTKVKVGQKIAESGNSGSVGTGPHLHFEFAKTNNRKAYSINPTNIYGDKDKRPASGSTNPQPLFEKNSKGNWVYKGGFVWTYSENPLPPWYNHDNYDNNNATHIYRKP